MAGYERNYQHCFYERDIGDTCRVIVDFCGHPLPINFPRAVLDHYGLEVGDEFEWCGDVDRDGEINISQIRAVQEESPLGSKEIEELKKFAVRGRTIEEILGEENDRR